MNENNACAAICLDEVPERYCADAPSGQFNLCYPLGNISENEKQQSHLFLFRRAAGTALRRRARETETETEPEAETETETET